MQVIFRGQRRLVKIKTAAWAWCVLLASFCSLRLFTLLRGDRTALMVQPETTTVLMRNNSLPTKREPNFVLHSLPNYDGEPDFGGLSITSLQNATTDFRRERRDPFNHGYNQERDAQLAAMDQFGHRKVEYGDEWLSLKEIANRTSFNHHQPECWQNNWKHLMFPNCNVIHEISPEMKDRKLLGKGSSRLGWLVQEQPQPSYVLKQLMWRHALNPKNFLRAQREALIMERLSYSNRIVDTYGYCGTSNLVETMPGGSMLHRVISVIPEDLQQIQRKIHETLPWLIPPPPIRPFNTGKRLDLAITVAESVAELHGFEGGIMFNTDLSLMQFLIGSQGEIKLNDFNQALIPGFDLEKNEYCKVKRRLWNNTRYPPEQYTGAPMDEAVDVYAVGDILCAILAGKWVKKGTRHSCNFSAKNAIEGRIEAIIERMWALDAAERPSIFEVVYELKEARQLYGRSWWWLA